MTPLMPPQTGSFKVWAATEEHSVVAVEAPLLPTLGTAASVVAVVALAAIIAAAAMGLAVAVAALAMFLLSGNDYVRTFS